MLKYAEIPYIDKNGQDVSISKKLNLLGSRKELEDKFYKDRLTPELIQQCRGWSNMGTKIEHDSVIGAGAVVTKDIDCIDCFTY